jgi:hypothetical protein
LEKLLNGGCKMKKILIALIVIMFLVPAVLFKNHIAKILEAATVQWVSTPQEKIVHTMKQGFYIRTDSDTPIDITVNETDKVTVYGSQTQPLQQKATSYDLIITLDGENVAITHQTLTDAASALTGIYVKPATSATWAATQSGTWTGVGVTNQTLTNGASADTGIYIIPSTTATFPVTNQSFTNSIASDSGLYVRPVTGATWAVTNTDLANAAIYLKQLADSVNGDSDLVVNVSNSVTITNADLVSIATYVKQLADSINSDSDIVVANTDITASKNYLKTLADTVNGDSDIVVNISNTSIAVTNADITSAKDYLKTLADAVNGDSDVVVNVSNSVGVTNADITSSKNYLKTLADTVNGDSDVVVSVSNSVGVTGTFYQAIQPTIEKEHYEIHEGDFYSATSVETDIDNAISQKWMFVAPDSAKRIHIAARISATGAGFVYFFAEGTVSDSGLAIPLYNNDRNSVKNTTLLAYKDPTVTTEGTLLMADYFGSNDNHSRIGGAVKMSAEYILKQGKTYLLKYTPDADDKTAVLVIEFYED